MISLVQLKEVDGVQGMDHLHETLAIRDFPLFLAAEGQDIDSCLAEAQKVLLDI